MKIKYTLTLFCVTLTLVFLLASCADSSEVSNQISKLQSNLDYQSNSNYLEQSNSDYLEQSNSDYLEQSNTDWLAKSNTDWINSIPVADVSKENCERADLSLNCFISVWKTDHNPTDTTVTGYSGTMSVKLPLVSEGTYDFYVDWGDESDVQKITSSDDATHEYATPGEYTIHIAGTIKGWRFFVSAFNQKAGTDNDYGDAAKLLNVTQWGSLSLGNTAGYQFYGAEYFNPTATDAPDVSETTSLVTAFYRASNFNADISDWDVSKVTVMTSMFLYATSFNNNGKPLDWGDKTSKVTNMSTIFGNASSFNQDISGWKVENVSNMAAMFWGASSFNNNGKGLDWGIKTSKVEDMENMFNGASAFNQDISGWNVCNVTDANRVNFDAGTSATWTAEEKPNWGMDCPTN